MVQDSKTQVLLYNTLSHKKEEFTPLNSKEVSLYTCGPTVYNYAHIGNLRSYIFEDFLRRMLEYSGYKVKHVMNITDVGHLTSDADSGEDKMLKGAKREKKTVWEIAEFYTEAFMQDMSALNLLAPSIVCKATDHIKEQISMIESLEKKGFTYTAGGNVYFDTSKLSDYGKLAGLDLKAEDKSQARVAVDENKKNSHDFVLWFTKSKFDDQAMKWKSPWGEEGYPGWHIECSAMASKYLGDQFDIHCGGIDHISVHHTNEIAQSEAALSVNKWVQFWMHGEFLVVGKDQKMSKSKDNFLTLAVIFDKGYSALDYRYFCLGAHYRKALTFSFEALESAKVARLKLQEKIWALHELAAGITLDKLGFENLSESAKGYYTKFNEQIFSDLNMPRALAVVWDLLKDNDLSDNEKYLLVINFDSVLGLRLDSVKPAPDVPEEVVALAEKRSVARASKDWEVGDKLREEVKKMGYKIQDNPDGSFELIKN
ncbi:cysteine--tRNA ligase [archaeon]|jgi:cysteinyl-tRNA synthetase|nr:cysteine--tRNA ligase [archaeon]MBT6761772.1 cysteine--tRNA ligase [archaeon]